MHIRTKTPFLLLTLAALCSSLFALSDAVMANETKITIDISQVKDLQADIHDLSVVGLIRTARAGEKHLRSETEKISKLFRVSSDVDEEALSASLFATAIRPARSAQSAEVIYPSGHTKEVTLRPQPEFDFAQAVAEGTGLYGPKKRKIVPREAKALLIPKNIGPRLRDNGTYVRFDGQYYIFSAYSRGMRPNPYHERAAVALEGDVEAIWDRVVKAFANQEEEF